MATVWQRFSGFAKSSQGEELNSQEVGSLPVGDREPPFRLSSAYKIPAEDEASQYRDLLAERSSLASPRRDPTPEISDESENLDPGTPEASRNPLPPQQRKILFSIMKIKS